MNFQPVILIIRKTAPILASSLLGAVVHRLKFPRPKSVEVSVQNSAEFDTPEGRISVRVGDDLRDPPYNPLAHAGITDELDEFNDAFQGVSNHA